MKATLQPGIEHTFVFKVGASKLVPALYPESEEFQKMPHVFATGFMVGLIEWTCIQALKPHIDWPREQSVGTHIDVSHMAATPPGLAVNVQVRLVEVNGRQLEFDVEAHDGIDCITQGRHKRFIIDKTKFDGKVADKAASA